MMAEGDKLHAMLRANLPVHGYRAPYYGVNVSYFHRKPTHSNGKKES